jgi:hypothetical protein
VPTMKLTFNAAMRARDVSRPRAEHLAAAEASEAGGWRAGAASGGAVPGSATSGGGTSGGPGSGDAVSRGAVSGGAAAGGAAAGAPGREKAKPSRVAAAMDERRRRAGFPRRRRGRSSR